MRRFFDLLLQNKKQSQKVYGMYRDNQIYQSQASILSFGITWAEIDKIVFDLYKLTTDNNNILFCTPGGPWIGYRQSQVASFIFSGLTGSANLSPAEITDGSRHRVEFSISCNATTEITNTWDRSYAKQTGYISVEFWKDNVLLKRFVPSYDHISGYGAGKFYLAYMVDTISGEKIRVSNTPYVFEEIV